MPERNVSIASVLNEIADLLDIQGANAFRVRAYRNAARSIGDLGTEVDVLMERGTPLTDIPGVGEDLSRKIVEILHTGTCEFLQRLHNELPAAITQLLKIPALGPRRVKTLYQDLHIENLEQLLAAAQAGQIRELPGFGEKTEQRILETAQGRIAMARRHPLVLAAGYAEPLADYLRAVPGVSRVEIAGSYRRMRASVGDIDMVAIAAPGSSIMERFVAYPGVTQVLSKGPTRSSVLLEPGLQVDLRSLPEPSFGAAMVYFTGSKAHNIAIRRMGQERGLKINEYGVFREALCIAGDTEESVYSTIDLPWIPPELREDKGEIEAAEHGGLPHLIQMSDVRGDLQLRLTPGEAPAAIIQEAGGRGLAYVAIVVDIPDRATLDIARAMREIAQLRSVKLTPSGPTVLVGIEAGIDRAGKLDVGDSILDLFDLTVASVHGGLDMPHNEQTQRVLTALDSDRVAILAQPWSDGESTVDFDFAAVARKATERGIALAVSLHPRRIAPPETFLEIAKREGARFLISSEAESAADLDALRLSVGLARRAGIEPVHVLNSNPISDLQAWLHGHKQRSGR
jgi:DNA polymerase (family X)